MTEIASIVLFAADGAQTADFYRAAGVDLEDETHDDGPLHWAVDLDGVHVAVYDAGMAGRAPGLRAAGSTFPGLYVSSLDTARPRSTSWAHQSSRITRSARGVAASSSKIPTVARWRSTKGTTVVEQNSTGSGIRFSSGASMSSVVLSAETKRTFGRGCVDEVADAGC